MGDEEGNKQPEISAPSAAPSVRRRAIGNSGGGIVRWPALAVLCACRTHRVLCMHTCASGAVLNVLWLLAAWTVLSERGGVRQAEDPGLREHLLRGK